MKTKTGNSLFNIFNLCCHPGRCAIYPIIFFLSVFAALKVKTGLFLLIVIACVISFFSASSVFAQTTANFTYDTTYGGLTGYQTPDSAQVDITRNGFGRHPVKMAYDNTKNSITTTYNFQDNAAGRRVVQERTIGTKTVTSHFLFGGGLRPKVEFRKDDSGSTTAHYTIYGPGGQVVSYVTTDSSGSTRLTPIHDRLGSTRALIDSSSGGSGKIEARFGYNTLGKPTETDGCTTDCDQYREYPYRFQGHRYLPFEDETATTGYTVGVTDNVDRLYSHDHGLRFMHTDIAGQSISPYTSYGNDPVNMVDLTGLTKEFTALINQIRTSGEKLMFFPNIHGDTSYITVMRTIVEEGVFDAIMWENTAEASFQTAYPLSETDAGKDWLYSAIKKYKDTNNYQNMRERALRDIGTELSLKHGRFLTKDQINQWAEAEVSLFEYAVNNNIPIYAIGADGHADHNSEISRVESYSKVAVFLGGSHVVEDFEIGNAFQHLARHGVAVIVENPDGANLSGSLKANIFKEQTMDIINATMSNNAIQQLGNENFSVHGTDYTVKLMKGNRNSLDNVSGFTSSESEEKQGFNTTILQAPTQQRSNEYRQVPTDESHNTPIHTTSENGGGGCCCTIL